eukprot:6189502-Amphidinium_carterae.1
MLQPFLSKPGGQHLPLTYVVIDVGKLPSGQRLAGGTCEPAELSGNWLWVKELAKVIVRNTVFVRLVFHHSSLDREQTDDDEVWYSASSDVEEGRKQ